MIQTLVYNKGQKVPISLSNSTDAGSLGGPTSIIIREVKGIDVDGITMLLIRICDLLVGDKIEYHGNELRVTSISKTVRFAKPNGTHYYKPSVYSKAWVRLLN